jgi:hypothetical protein
VGCTIGSRGEVPGKKKPVVRDDDDDGGGGGGCGKNELVFIIFIISNHNIWTKRYSITKLGGIVMMLAQQLEYSSYFLSK